MRFTTYAKPLCALMVGIMSLGFAANASASSHREAPMIGNDPLVDNTDVYAFVSPENPDRVVLISNFIPLTKPESGPNFWYFAQDARYEIHVNNGNDDDADLTFRFTFSPRQTKNVNTFLFNTGAVTDSGDPDLNVTQGYRVQIFKRGEGEIFDNGSNRNPFPLQVAPDFVGQASFPNGSYATVAQQAVKPLNNVDRHGTNIRVFCGSRAEQFYLDLGATFDLLQVNPASPVNGTARTNVHTIALEVPKTFLTRNYLNPTDPKSQRSVIGVWSTTSRRSLRVLAPARPNPGYTPSGGAYEDGPYVQVSRLGAPLFNELLIPLALKDVYNASSPRQDNRLFKKFAEDPEPARLLKALFGVNVPPAPRADLVQVFLSGVTGVTQFAKKPPVAEMLRLNMAIPPTPKNSATFSTLGVIGGDLAGYPNGRRVDDDTVDITLRAAAGVLVTNFNVAPNNALSDGVNQPDSQILASFPFIGLPFPGR